MIVCQYPVLLQGGERCCGGKVSCPWTDENDFGQQFTRDPSRLLAPQEATCVYKTQCLERNEIQLVILINLLVKCLLLVYYTLGFTASLVSWKLIRFLFLKVLQVYHDQDNNTLVTKCRYPKIVIHIWSLPLLQLMKRIDCDADMTCFTRMVWSETLC